MKPSNSLLHRQFGAYLLEALIGILIFSLGVLGIVGLQAASLRSTSDDALQAEAVLAANQYIGQIWADEVDNSGTIIAKYSSTIGTGVPYQDFVNKVSTAFGGAYDAAYPPKVEFNNAAPPSTTSVYVVITIYWKSCQTTACTDLTVDQHNYQASAVIGAN